MPETGPSLNEVLGRDPMPIPELIKQLRSASWPEIAVVSTEDFLALSFGANGVQRLDDGTPYFYVGPTKVQCKKSRPGLVDLSKWEAPLIEVARFGR